MPDLKPEAPNLQFSVMCLDLTEDAGPPSLKYLFYELPLPELPYKVPRFFLINGWINGRGNFRQSVKVLSTSRSKTLIDTGDQPFTLTDPATPQMMINQIADLTLAEVGQHWVQIFLDGNSILEYPVTVRLASNTKPIDLYLPNPAARITKFPSAGLPG